VTYNGNGSTGGTVPIDINNYLPGDTATIASAGTLVRNSYTFAGWNTAPDGNGTGHLPFATLPMSASVVTLYAEWALNTGPAFVATWITAHTNVDTSAGNQITLPLDFTGTYDFVVNWGDTSEDTIVAGNDSERTHTYAVPGTYQITITGVIDGFRFGYGGDNIKIIDISEWGPLRLGNNGAYFAGAVNLTISATDAPDFIGTTNMQDAFWSCSSPSLVPGMANWDVSGVTNMGGMFRYAIAFNQDISGWNVSNATSMATMFSGATSFNQDIGGWDVSSVTNMASIFGEASAFNQDLSGWNVSNVAHMHAVFRGTAFNQDISGWDVSSVTDMLGMFESASAFNQDIGGWDVSNVTDMEGMFYNAVAFDQDIGGWDVSSVMAGSMGGMSSMFYGVTLTTGNYDALLNGWAALPSLQPDVQFSGGPSRYSTSAASARLILAGTYGWNITDGGPE
jgi:uncharacterized repeat protein (TIGR02543 family)